MPGRSIGAVYITVLANTTAFEREVKDAARDAGDESAANYSKHFNKAFANIEKSKEFDKLANDLAKQWHEIGRDNGDSWETGFKDARITKAVDVEIKRIADKFGISQDKVAREISSRLGGAYHDVERDADKALRSISNSARREGKNAERDLGAPIFRTLRKVQNSLRRMGSGGVFAGITSVLGAIVGLASGAAQGLLKLGGILLDLGATAVTAVKGLFKTAEAVGEIGATAAEVAAEDAIGAVGGAIEAVETGGLSLIPVLATLGVAFVTLSVTGGVVVAFLGIAAAAMSALAGMAVILTAALVPVLGSVLALVPLLPAVALAFVGIFLAIKPVLAPLQEYVKIMGETDSKKKAKELETFRKEVERLPAPLRDAVNALTPLLDKFKGIAQTASGDFWANFKGGLADLQPLVDVIGPGLDLIATALGSTLTQMLAILDTKEGRDEFNLFFQNMSQLISQFGPILGQLLLGLLGLFNALSPSASVFLGWLSQAIGKFTEWVTSTKGQNSIQSFMDTATESIGKVWDILKTLGHAFGTLLGPEGAQKDGQGLLDKIDELAHRFDTWISQVTKDGTLQTWLENAKTVASDLGTLIHRAADFFDKLDTPQNRKTLSNLLKNISNIVDKINEILPAIESVVNFGGFVLSTFIQPWKTLWAEINKVVQIVEDLVGWIGKIDFPSLPSWANPANLNPFHHAAGGLFTIPHVGMVAESGAEAVIPLTGALSSVDPSVRWMAAMLRGQTVSSTAGAVRPGGGVSPTINVYPISSDPMAVAVAVFNRAVSAAKV